MSEKYTPTTLAVIQVKNQRKKVGILDAISWLEKGVRIVDIGLMSDPLILAYLQFLIMLIELQKVLCQELKCLCSKTTRVISE